MQDLPFAAMRNGVALLCAATMLADEGRIRLCSGSGYATTAEIAVKGGEEFGGFMRQPASMLLPIIKKTVLIPHCLGRRHDYLLPSGVYRDRISHEKARTMRQSLWRALHRDPASQTR
jgi:hypothetical protein